MPWLQRDFVDDFVSDLKTATIDSVDDLVDNFVDDFVNETAIDLKNWLENIRSKSGPSGPGVSIKIFLIAHFWHFNAFEHRFDWLKPILTSS